MALAAFASACNALPLAVPVANPPLPFQSLLKCHLLGFPDTSVGKEATCNAGDPSLTPGLGRSAGGGIGYPLQYSWASLA